MKRGAVTFDYGNNIRGEALAGGLGRAFDIPGFVPEYIRPLFCDGKGPFRWAALSGDPEDIYRTDRALLETFPENVALRRWIEKAQKQVRFQGLPARICWLGYGERATMGASSMIWSPAARSAHRLSSAGTIWIAALSRRRTARRKKCRTAVTPLPTGRFSMRC